MKNKSPQEVLSSSMGAILLAYGSMMLFALSDNIRGTLYPEILRDFELSNTLGAWFFAIASLSSVVGALATKNIIRKRGYKQTLLIGLGLLLVAVIGVSVSPRFPVLIAFIMALGVAFGILGVIQNALVSKAAPEHQLLQYQSALHSIYGFFSFIAPLYAALIFSFFPSWRLPFAVLALPALLLIFKTWQQNELISRQDEEATQNTKWPDQMPSILLWSLILSLYVVAEIFVATRLAQYLREVQSFSLNQASVGVAVFFGGLFLGRTVFIFARWKVPLLFQIQTFLGLTALLLFLGLIKGLSFIGNHWLLALSGLAMGPIYPMTMTWVAKRFKNHIETTLTACMVMAGIFNLVMHTSVGVLTDKIGIAQTFWLGPVVALFAFGLVFRYRLSGDV